MRLVIRERVGFVARAIVGGVVLREDLLHPVDEAACRVCLRGSRVIADHLERLAGGLMILADHEQARGLADLDPIALGRDPFGLRALP